MSKPLKQKSELSSAFDIGLKLLNIKAVDISRKTGLTEGQLSRFRSGENDIGASDFAKIVRVLPPKMQQVIIDCFLHDDCPESEIANKLLKNGSN